MKAEGGRRKTKGGRRKAEGQTPAPLWTHALLSPFFILCLFSACHRALRAAARNFLRHFRLPSSAFLLLPFAFCLLPASGAAETLTLAGCLQETAAANPQIVGAQFDLQQADGQRLALRSRALPTLTASGILGYQGAQTSQTVRSTGVDAAGKPLPNTTNPRNSTFIAVASAQFTQPIFDAAVPASWRQGTLGVTAARQNLYTVATAQLFRARTLFNRALYNQRRDELLRQTDQVLQGNLKAQRLLVDAGLGARQGVLAAQVQRANFDPVITGNGGTSRTNLAALLQIMGRQLPESAGKSDPLDGLTAAGALDDSPLAFDPAAAAREALDERPDLQILRTTVRIYAESANIARGGYLPTVKLYVAGQYLPQSYLQAQSATNRASDRVQTTEIRPGVRADWTVIDTGSILGATRQFGALREVIEASLQKLEADVPRDLATVHGQAVAASDALKELQGAVTTSQDTLNIINAGIAQGVNSQLEFLDAQSGVFATRLGLLEAQFALSQTHAEFDRITGRYLRFVTDPGLPPHPVPAKK